MNIICFGDSITHAAGLAEGDRWPTVLQYRLNEGTPGQYHVYNRGIGGHTVCQGFDRFGNDVRLWLPGVLLCEFGFNDANVYPWTTQPRVGLPQFRAHLTEFARLAAANDSRCIFIVNHRFGNDPTPQGNGKPYAENFAPYNEAIRELATAIGVPTIDLPKLMDERAVKLADFLAADQLHLSPAGNHTYAALVHEGLHRLGIG